MSSIAKNTEDAPGNSAILQLSAIFCALVCAAWILYANRSFYHDDAYITLRYVWNFLNGQGIVWNVGEYVQGYSNFLQLALVSALGLAGVDLVAASRVTGLLAFGLLVSVLWLFLRCFRQRKDLGHVPVIFTLTSAPMIVWSIGGLGDTLLALFTSTGCLLFLAAFDQPGNRRLLAASGICLALGYLAHPDGLVFVALSLFWLLVTPKSRPLRSAVAFALPCLLILGAYTLWLFFYYGDIVPNTFYAKADNFNLGRLASGWRYILSYTLQAPYLPILVVAVLIFGMLTRKLQWNARLTYLALVISAYSSFIVFIGGDHMRTFRLVLPLVVPLSYMLYLLLVSTVDASKRNATVMITAVALLLCGLQPWQFALNPRVEDPAARIGTLIGKYISDAWPTGALIALNTAGSIPYYAPQDRFIDMLGLNDRHIAKRHIDKIELPKQNRAGHLKGDGAYVLSRAPDFIIVGPAEGTSILRPWFLSDLEMGRDPRFFQHYEFHQDLLDLPDGIDQRSEILFSYYRRVN